MVSSDARYDGYVFSKAAMVLNIFRTDWTWKWNLRFRGLRWVNVGDVCLRILLLTCSAFQCLLIHTISITTTMVMTIQRQHSCGALADCRKFNSSIGFETWTRFQNLVRIMIFKIVILLSWLGSFMICTHGLIVLTKTKEMIRYCGSYAFDGKSALNTHF
jgi:hypothetical protein